MWSSRLAQGEGVRGATHSRKLSLLRYFVFQECQAHLDSSRHKYLSAAVKFSELAAMDASLTGFSAAHSRELLGEAITSAVLAASGGPSRTRVLVELYKDPRSRTLVDHYPLLERMYGVCVFWLDAVGYHPLLTQPELLM